MKISKKWIAVGLMASFFLAGCGKQPAEEMNAAQVKIEDLKNQGAALYIGEDFERLNNDLTVAMNEVQVQDEKLIRSYGKAKQMLVRVIEDAETYGRILPSITNTQAAIDASAKEDAALYAKEETKKLTDDFQAALTEVRNQNAQATKDYQKAQEMLAMVQKDAGGLISIISGRKEEAKNRTIVTQKEAQDAVGEAKKLLEAAMKGKKPSPAIEGLSSKLKALDDSLGEIQTAFDRGEYLGAFEKATIVKERAAEIKKQGEQTLAQMKSSKKK